MSDTRLSNDDLIRKVNTLPGWRLSGDDNAKVFVRDFKFPDFVAAMQFVNRVADAAEGAAHHPDIDIRYNLVRLALVTHDAGGITQQDVSLAHTADDLAKAA